MKVADQKIESRRNIKYGVTFSIVYHFKQLAPDECLFLSRIIGFYENKKPILLSNESWAVYLGISQRQVSRIKNKFRELKVIEGKTNHIKLLVKPSELSDYLDKKMAGKGDKYNPLPVDRDSPVGDVSSQDGEIDSHGGGIIDKTIDKEIDKIIDNSSSTLLTFDNFIRDPEIISVNHIEFLGSELELKSSILSYYYNCINDTPISGLSLTRFNSSVFYSPISRFLRCCMDKSIQPKRYLDVDINRFIMIIETFYRVDEGEPKPVPTTLGKQLFDMAYGSGKPIEQAFLEY